jgi:hypothetical protein
MGISQTSGSMGASELAGKISAIQGEAMQKVDVKLEDDLTGGPADETVHFGVDGRAYEIDLNAKHAARLRGLLAPFVERARLARGRRPQPTASRKRSRQIRAWAGRRGLNVADHGRLPDNVINEYQRSHGEEQPSQPGRARGGRLVRGRGLRKILRDVPLQPSGGQRPIRHRAPCVANRK